MLSQNEDRKEDGEERSRGRGRKQSISRRKKGTFSKEASEVLCHNVFIKAIPSTLWLVSVDETQPYFQLGKGKTCGHVLNLWQILCDGSTYGPPQRQIWTQYHLAYFNERRDGIWHLLLQLIHCFFTTYKNLPLLQLAQAFYFPLLFLYALSVPVFPILHHSFPSVSTFPHAHHSTQILPPSCPDITRLRLRIFSGFQIHIPKSESHLDWEREGLWASRAAHFELIPWKTGMENNKGHLGSDVHAMSPLS